MVRKSLFFVLFGSLLLGVLGFSQSSFADFSFSDEFGSQGNNDDEFDTPTDLAINNNDQLYVVDSENNRIKMFELTGGSNCPSGTDEIINDEVCFDEDFGSSGSSDGRFDIPTNLAIDKNNGDIYVVDSDNNRIQKFQADGDYDNLEFGSSSSGDDEYLGNPSAIAIHESSDYIYVADSTTDSISVFDDNGDFRFSFDDDDSGDEFKNPSGMVIDDGEDILYVADTGNDRIRIFELTDGSNCPSGTDEVVNDEVCFVDDFGSSGSGDGEFDAPSGLAFDEDNGLLYVADTDNHRVQVFEIVSGNTCPSGTDEIIDGVCFVGEFGSSGSGDGKFNAPSGLAFDEDNGLLYVADTDNHRVQILGTPESSSSGSSSSSSNDVPNKPTNLVASAVSPSAIFLTWKAPIDDDSITGYKIDYRVGSGNYSTLVGNTQSTATYFIHDGLDEDERYYYKVYAINSDGTSVASSSVYAEPQETLAPSGLTATAISPSQIKLEWFPPTETFGGSITSYTIEREVIPGVYDDETYDAGKKTEHTISNLQTDKTYTYVVSATFTVGGSPISDSASATPQEDSKAPSSSTYITIPDEPSSLTATATSSEIKLSWKEPLDDGGSSISGYKIEVKDNGSYSVLKDKTTSTSYTHDDVETDTKYTYRVYAINSIGTSSPKETSATPTETAVLDLEISPLGKFNTNEQNTLSFTVKITDSSIDDVKFTLKNAPSGAKIGSNTGQFTWTPNSSQGTNTYTFDIIAAKGSEQDTQSVTITVKDVPVSEPKQTTNEPLVIPAPFVDTSKDPQSYVERYNTEASYKKWFDDNYSEYSSIYEAVGLEESKEASSEPKIGECGPGTKLINGKCELEQQSGGGCLIATAAYGSEMAPQVQFLREIRDNQLMSTDSGVSFMTGFNQLYYSFSPYIADYERESPAFRELVKIGLTPLLSSLSLMSFAESESEVLGYGIGVILMNLGMYFVAPAMLFYGIRKIRRVRF